MRFAIVISVMLHVVAVGVWYVLPDSWKPVAQSEPIIPIEIISEAELSDMLSVVETRIDAEPEPEQQPAPEEIEEIEPEPVVQPEQPVVEPEPIVEQAPDPLPEEQEPEEIPEPEEKKEEPKKEEPKKREPPKVTPPKKEEPKEPELDFDALRSGLEDLDREKTEAPREAAEQTGQAQQDDRNRNQVGAGDRLTASEEAKMRAHMAQCWSRQAFIGAPEPEKLLVTVRFELNRDGSLRSAPKVINSLQINTSGNAFWKVAERAALNAVIECAPYDFLSQERLNSGVPYEMTFNPAQMVGL